MRSSPRLNRGTSVIAALVFAALLGAVALGLHAFQGSSVNTAALPAEMSAAIGSSDQVCQAGQDYDHTLPQSQALVDTNLGTVTNADYAQTDVTNTVCPSDADATTKIKAQYTGYPASAMPTTVSLAPTNTNRIICTNGTPSTAATNSNACTYTKQSDGTFKLQTWMCNVRVYAPNVDDPSQRCKVYPVPLGQNVSASGVISANSGAQVYGSTGITPTIPPSLQNNCQTTTQVGTITCTGSDAQNVQSALPGYNCSQSSQVEGTITCVSSTAGQDELSASSNSNSSETGRSDDATNQTQPVGAGINCDQNPDDCPKQQDVADQPTDQNTYCYDGGKTCYPPDSEIKQYQADNWNCNNKDETGATYCVANPSANALTQQPQNQNQTQTKQQTQNSNNSSNPISSFLKGLTGSTLSQNQGGLQNNSCSGLSSLIGLCSSISCQLSISPNPPQPGMPANLTWTSSGNVYMAQISGVGNVGPTGSYTVYPGAGANYSMTVYGQNNSGQASCNTAVNGSSLSGCTGTNSCASSQAPYGVGTNGQACSQPPPQPVASQCTSGSWQPISAANNGCITSYQCGGQAAGQPTAQLSCSPQVADVGMSVALSYSCANATGSSGAGFSTGNQTSGSTTTVISAPPSGTNTANFGLTCSNGSQASGAQCSVQINQPAIVLVANPRSVPQGQPSSIGWVTAGMQSCAISSPQDSNFTAQNASNQSVNGVAQTDAINQDTEFDLTCTTLGGQTKIASTTVSVNGSGSGTTSTSNDITITSSADGASADHGDTVTINWSTPSAASSTALSLSLWLIDVRTQAATALIASGQSASGSYKWKIPNTSDTCDATSYAPCASDLVAGRSYALEAALYTPSNAYIGPSPDPAGAVDPTYTDYGFTSSDFTIGQ